MKRVFQAWPCAVSAVLLLGAFPPVGQWWLVFVALVPWLASLRSADGRAAFRSGYCFGVVYGLGVLEFFAALTYQWTHSLSLAALPWVVGSLIFALYFGLAGVLIQRCWTRGWAWLIPIAWVGVEVFRAYIPLFAFPWALVADPLVGQPWLIQSAHYGSVFLVSGVALLTNVIFCQCLSGQSRSAAIMTACTAALVVFSALRLSTGGGQPLVVSVLQPGTDMAYGDEATLPQRLRAAIDPLLALADHDGSAMAVLPEGVAEARTMPPDVPFSIPRIPILFGARRGRRPSYESAFAYNGGKWSYVDKTRLVIFGEFVPGRDLFPFLAEAFKLPTGDMTAGIHGVQALQMADHTIGPVICFEEMFPEVAYRQALNGSELLAVISIDDWFMNSNAPEELRAGCIWRAIETGLPLVRSASSGYTMALDGEGRVLGQLRLRVSSNLRAVLPLNRGSQMFPLLPAFPILSLAGALVLLILGPKKRVNLKEEMQPAELAGV